MAARRDRALEQRPPSRPPAVPRSRTAAGAATPRPHALSGACARRKEPWRRASRPSCPGQTVPAGAGRSTPANADAARCGPAGAAPGGKAQCRRPGVAGRPAPARPRTGRSGRTRQTVHRPGPQPCSRPSRSPAAAGTGQHRPATAQRRQTLGGTTMPPCALPWSNGLVEDHIKRRKPSSARCRVRPVSTRSAEGACSQAEHRKWPRT